MSRPIVKVCGVTRVEEIEGLAACGADFFGLVCDVPSPWTITPQRAAALAHRGSPQLRATLVTRACTAARLSEMISATGVRAVQTPVLSSPNQIRRLRATFSPQSLAILQQIPYRQGEFVGERQIDEYLAAGADYILIDTSEKVGGHDSSRATIPERDLTAFGQRQRGRPILVAGGVSPLNVRSLVAASCAKGIDVCSSVRRDGMIQRELVARLVDALFQRNAARAPSLRQFLQAAAPGNQVIAYLTIGDPPEGFVALADELLEAGALTLELGFPDSAPLEGPTIAASHARALKAGITVERAVEMFRSISERHPTTPLVAVVQWARGRSERDSGQCLDQVAEAGAAAVLPVGLPFWQLAASGTGSARGRARSGTGGHVRSQRLAKAARAGGALQHGLPLRASRANDGRLG
jgi:phosphoribosylanthranilate isomerase